MALSFTDVFVPGGFPHHTYNPRLELQIEAKLSQVKSNLCKLVTVTGHTKSGKTVAVRSVLPREDAVWVDGGTVGEESDFWEIILDQLDLFTSVEDGHVVSASSTQAAKVSLGGDALGGSLGCGTELEQAAEAEKRQGRNISSRVAALKGLLNTKTPLVVDDFHYLPKELQGILIRALKPAIFDGVPVVIIAIPHRRYDAIRVEKEMTGRILPLDIPTWTERELKYVPETGFTLLARQIDLECVERLAGEAIGSPHLVQEFCRTLCANISPDGKTLPEQLNFDADAIERAFRQAGDSIGKPIFEKLSRGPRQRSDRMVRTLVDGREVDIYGLVLHALAHLKPSLVTLEYEDLRAALRSVAREIPQLHEVARVLKHMSEIAASDQSSTPVIDFDEESKVLHVTDPFFAFYLRWGSLDS